jgi:hypothetical protein
MLKKLNQKNRENKLLESTQPKDGQLENYKDFFQYLLSDSNDEEIADEV